MSPSRTKRISAVRRRHPPPTDPEGFAAPAGAARPSPAARAAMVLAMSRRFGDLSRRIGSVGDFMGSFLLSVCFGPLHRRDRAHLVSARSQ
jgi:hypothetical protein